LVIQGNQPGNISYPDGKKKFKYLFGSGPFAEGKLIQKPNTLQKYCKDGEVVRIKRP
jgi:hypothetical protein